MASSQGNGKFTEFICLHGADSVSQKSPKCYLMTHYFTYSPKFFCQFIVLPIHQSFPPPKFSTIWYIKSNDVNKTNNRKNNEGNLWEAQNRIMKEI